MLDSFPVGTQMTNPAGGMVVWIVLPPHIDVTELYETVRLERIAFAPGPMFTLSDNYRNCLRLNATTWNPIVESAIQTIGTVASRLSRG